MLVIELLRAGGEGGEPEYLGKNLSEQKTEPTTNLTLWRRRRDLNLGNTGGRRVLSPLRHHLLPKIITILPKQSTIYKRRLLTKCRQGH